MSNGHGGARNGAGRRKGGTNERSKKLQEQADALGVDPVVAMLHNIKWAQDQLAALEHDTLSALVDGLSFMEGDDDERLSGIAKNLPVIKELRDMVHKNAKDAAPFIHAKLASMQVEGTGEDGEIVFKTVYEKK